MGEPTSSCLKTLITQKKKKKRRGKLKNIYKEMTTIAKIEFKVTKIHYDQLSGQI